MRLDGVLSAPRVVAQDWSFSCPESCAQLRDWSHTLYQEQVGTGKAAGLSKLGLQSRCDASIDKLACLVHSLTFSWDVNPSGCQRNLCTNTPMQLADRYVSCQRETNGTAQATLPSYD
jgi:hypothetical protein